MQLPNPQSLSDGFQELADSIWSQAAGPQPHEDNPSGIREILAELLRKAASGNGFVPLRDLKQPPSVLAKLPHYPQLFTLDGEFLMLPRYAHHCEVIRCFFKSRLETRHSPFDHALVASHLDALLPRQILTNFDNAQQRLAIALLVDASVGVLTGGPGTGKTTTAAALLAVRRRLDPTLSSDRILVTAPTGKAACRIAEAITKSASLLQDLTEAEKHFLRSIRAITLHRALEWGPLPPEKGGPFKRNENSPLNASIVLVDEASMVDLSLMHALVKAMPAHASLYLLGDSDQLKSVDVGGILSELVQRAGLARKLDAPRQDLLQARLRLNADEVQSHFEAGLPSLSSPQADPLPGLVAGLKYSRRAMNAPWILSLADVVRPGTQQSLDSFLEIFETKNNSHALAWHRQNAEAARKSFCAAQWNDWVEKSHTWTGLLQASSDGDILSKRSAALALLEKFQLLCSTNAQVNRANNEGIALLQKERSAGNPLPHGCPVIILSNQRSLGLSNGDVGIALGSAHGEAALVALFPSPDGIPRLVPMAQLPAHQPAFALTIHKSQGSEWQHIAIELPSDPDSTILTRNLLYTAITRSSRAVDLFGPESVIQHLLKT